MRACRFAVVVATLLAVAGCRSGNSGWTWGRKKSDAAMADTDPALPSTGAAPANYGTPYSSAAAAQGTSAFAAPGAPAGGAPGSYEAAPYPDQVAGAAGAPGAAPPAGYGAGSAMAQQGPYSQSYGQPPAAAEQPPAYPATATPYGYQPPAQPGMPPAGATASPAEVNPYDLYGGGASPPANASAGPPHNRRAAIRTRAAQPPAGNPYGARSAPAADHYGTAGTRAAGAPLRPMTSTATPTAAHRRSRRWTTATWPITMRPPNPRMPSPLLRSREAAQLPAGPSTAGSPTAPYQPGSSDYDPGNTGYSPPGVPAYESGAPSNVVAARKDPYYRPGGTTDYVPAGTDAYGDGRSLQQSGRNLFAGEQLSVPRRQQLAGPGLSVSTVRQPTNSKKSTSAGRLGEHVFDHAAVDEREPLLGAVVEVAQPLVIQTQQVQHCRV